MALFEECWFQPALRLKKNRKNKALITFSQTSRLCGFPQSLFLFVHAVPPVVALTAPVPFVASRHFPTLWRITPVLQKIITYLTEYSKTPKPSRFSGFSFCFDFYFGANLVQVILKGYDTQNVIVLLIFVCLRMNWNLINWL